MRGATWGRVEGVGDETVRLAELGELTAEELAASRVDELAEPVQTEIPAARLELGRP